MKMKARTFWTSLFVLAIMGVLAWFGYKWYSKRQEEEKTGASEPASAQNLEDVAPISS
jgi:predicted negative regulator of RcsB-dependent stress response